MSAYHMGNGQHLVPRPHISCIWRREGDVVPARGVEPGCCFVRKHRQLVRLAEQRLAPSGDTNKVFSQAYPKRLSTNIRREG